MFVDKIFERATIRGIADYLLFGMGPNQDNRSYEERLDEPYMRFEKAVEKYDKCKTSDLLDLCNEVSSEMASVYMEIGLQVGVLIIMDLIQNISNNQNNEIFNAYSARTAHPFQRNGAPFRFKLSKAQQVD